MGEIEKEKIIRFLISLCLSIFLWGYVTNMHNPFQEKTITNVPVIIGNLEALESQNLAIDSASQITINVVVSGRYSTIQNASSKDLSVKMDLSDLALKEGTNTVLLEVSSLNKDLSIVKEKTPLQVRIETTKLLQKEIPIVIESIGTLANGYIAGEPFVSKDKVICSGTKEALSSVKHVLATVELNNFDSNIKTTVPLKAINIVGDESSNVSLKDKEIEIEIPVFYSKEVPIEVVTKGSLPYGYKLEKYTLDKSTIVIKGTKEYLDTISSIKTEAIDLSRRYYDFDKKINLIFPENTTSKNNITSIYGSFVVTKDR